MSIAAIPNQTLAALTIAATISASVTACSTVPHSTATQPVLAVAPTNGDTTLALRHIEGAGRYGSPLRAVVTDSITLHRLWSLTTNLDPSEPEPHLDFSREMLILVALGAVPTTGWGIEVDSVTSTGQTVVAFVTIHVPGRNCIVGNAFTLPTDAVMVERPRYRSYVRFSERVHVNECPPLSISKPYP